MSYRVEQPMFFPKLGDRIRIVINHNNEWKPIFWFMVSRDGSLYLGPRYKNISTMKYGKGLREGGKVKFSYSEGVDVIDDKFLTNPHLSFHASGVIHFGGKRSFRDPFRGLDSLQEVCFVIFQSLDKFLSLEDDSKIKKNDVYLNYPIDMNCPLIAKVFASPMEKFKIVIQNQEHCKYQINPTFNYLDLDIKGINNLCLQIVLYHGPEGPWPPNTYIVFKSINENN